MALSAGSRLGPYEIVAPLGAGRMGEVYRARDPRLSREVAIKVLPAELASDAARLKRFEKEARSASALNHPNIVTIYDFGSSDAIFYIAMECVEGTTLRELLGSGPLPIKKLLQLAPQIADGLARAHEAGIVHRDLKPDNVMVTKASLVKILDFGLAKLTHAGIDSDESSQIPTEVGTNPGTVVGTPGYMSPEQASAKPLDFRSDQFSFGSILYEMATGKRAFQKKTSIDTLSAILNDDPEPIGQFNPQMPAPLRWITERCLAKEPEQRYRSTEDLARDLATVRDRLSEASSSGEALSITPASRRRRLGYLVAAAALLAVVGGVFALGKRAGETPLPTFHQLTFRRGAVLTARFTSDGRTVVYSAAWDELPLRVFSTRIENPESGSIPLPDSDLAAVSSLAELLVFPDRTFVPYGRNPSPLARVPLAGGSPRVIAESVQSADWGPDGNSVALFREVDGHRQLEYPVGKVLLQSTDGISPRVSRDGKLIAYYTGTSSGDSVAVVDLSGKTKILSTGWKFVGSYLAWSPKGDEVWFTATKGGWSAPVRAVSLSGRERVLLRLPGWVNIQDVSSDGYVLLDFGKNRQTIRCRLPGWDRERDLSWFESSTVWDLSADGKTIVFTERGETAPVTTIYLRKTDGSPPQRLGDGNPVHLSPDGRNVLAGDERGLFLLPTGPGEPIRLPSPVADMDILNLNWFPDSRRLLAVLGEKGQGPRTSVIDVEKGGRQPWSPEGFDCYLLSPDGSRAVCRTPQGERIYSFDRKEAREIPTLPHEDIIQWGADSDSLYVVADGNDAGTKISRLDLSTGKRQFWRELGPLDQTALVQQPLAIKLTPDGNSYCYNTWQLFHDLYLVEGLR